MLCSESLVVNILSHAFSNLLSTKSDKIAMDAIDGLTHRVPVFQKISGGTNGLNLTSVIEETRLFGKYFGNFCRLHAFFIRKSAQEHLGSSKKSDFFY